MNPPAPPGQNGAPAATSAAPAPSAAAIVTQQQLKRERLRFTDFRFNRTPSGHCGAEVRLEWVEGVNVMGKAQGHSSELGDLRIAAEAALSALESFSGQALRFELIGIKLVRAFDANVIIVSVGMKQGEGPRRLIGCYLAEHDPVRGAVVAVLNATNRVLGNFIATR
ncbi:MAG: hypothetical protein ACRENI_11390 [Gemmatimonadaceae bacterium]